MDVKTTSYTAANAIPIKIFKNIELVRELINKRIPAYHVQFIPTNKCNLNCSFCSCKKRNKREEMPFDTICAMIPDLIKHGCKAVTITGGGEPMVHPRINEILNAFGKAGIKIGLVSNGSALDKLLSPVKWCRISCADERVATDKTFGVIANAVKRFPEIDWAFSYVVGGKFNPKNLTNYIKFANDNNFTHVRVVSDLCALDTVPDMDVIKAAIDVDDSRVIYQGRKDFVRGTEKCWISLLKPVIGPQGNIYPCCGVQYAHEQQDLNLPNSMCMGSIQNMAEIYKKKIPFDGSKCDRCYYQNYNDILDMMLQQTDHQEFV